MTKCFARRLTVACGAACTWPTTSPGQLLPLSRLGWTSSPSARTTSPRRIGWTSSPSARTPSQRRIGWTNSPSARTPILRDGRRKAAGEPRRAVSADKPLSRRGAWSPPSNGAPTNRCPAETRLVAVQRRTDPRLVVVQSRADPRLVAVQRRAAPHRQFSCRCRLLDARRESDGG